MNELIKVEMNEKQEQVVSSRELHKNLGIKERFSLWWERNSKSLNLREGLTHRRQTYTATTNREYDDFAVPLDIAKHICMVSGGEKAWQIRDYFIEVEKAWNTPEAVYARALKMADRKLLDYKQEVKQLQDTIAYKNEVIKGAVMDVDVLTKRNVLNRVVRYRGANFSERWRELYKSYKETYHMDLKARTEGYNIRQSKKKDHLTTIGYAEKFGHIDDLYKVALKLYETDVNDILEHLKEIA